MLIKTVSGRPSSITYTETDKNEIYQQIPDKTKATLDYRVKSVLGSNTYYEWFNGKVLNIESGLEPTFSDFDFEDVNALALSLTGNNQKLIQGQSQLKVTIPVSKQAVGKKYSTITRYLISGANQRKELTYTGGEVSHTFSNIQANAIQIIAYDSRGLSTPVQKTFVLIPYTKPTIQEMEITRQDGVSTTGLLFVSGKFKNVDFGLDINKITKAEYRIVGQEQWTEITTAVTYDTTNGTFKESTMNQIPNFTFGTEYNVEVRITDILQNVSMTVIVNSGKVLFAYDKENHRIGIGCIPWGGNDGVYINDTIYSSQILGYTIVDTW